MSQNSTNIHAKHFHPYNYEGLVADEEIDEGFQEFLDGQETIPDGRPFSLVTTEILFDDIEERDGLDLGGESGED